MSLDKSIKSGKEHRNPKRKADRSCEVGGDCPFCQGNRTYAIKKAAMKADCIQKES